MGWTNLVKKDNKISFISLEFSVEAYEKLTQALKYRLTSRPKDLFMRLMNLQKYTTHKKRLNYTWSTIVYKI